VQFKRRQEKPKNEHWQVLSGLLLYGKKDMAHFKKIVAEALINKELDYE